MNAYDRAVREIKNARTAELDDGLAVFRAALTRDAELNSAYVSYQNEAIKNARGEDNGLEQAKTALKAELKRVGLTRDMIVPPYQCSACNDTGYVGGRYCACVLRRVINSDRENLVLPLVDFVAARKTAPKAVSKVYARAQKLVDAYPDIDKPFFVVSGSSGTGKTVLCAALATALMQKGAAVVTVSAFEFLKRAKEYHTQFAIDDYKDLFTPMLDCDVLCIDDLGTETMLKNITREYLFTVINERWLRRKITVVTTNLSPNALISRYGETVFSRLCDKSLAQSFIIDAENARLE